MSSITIDNAIKHINEIYPYLKPMSYVRFGSLFVFQMENVDGSPILFDNLIAFDRFSGLSFPFNPLKFDKEYIKVAKNFIDI